MLQHLTQHHRPMPGDGGDSAAQAPPPQPPQQPQPKPWRTPRPIANSLEEAFDFWDNIFDVLCDGKDDEECMEILERLASDLEQDSLSTAFSGIRAPETATSILRFRLGKTPRERTQAQERTPWSHD